jgi:hypothetical protein
MLMDRFTTDPNLVWALWCILVAMLVALLLVADATATYVRELKSGMRRGKKWWQK